MRELARRIGKPVTTYNHYENPQKFKDDYLPMALAQEIAKALDSEGFADQVLALSGVAAPTRVENGDTAPNDKALVSVYDVTASAGPGAVNEYEPQTHSLAFPPDYLKKLTSSPPSKLAIISVKGDSMEPTLLGGDIVLLDTSKTHLGYDGLFVLRMDDVLHVKRVGRSAKSGHITIISDNPSQSDFEKEIGAVTAVGKVLWYGRKV